MQLDYIYNGDCKELFKTIPDKSIDLVITDPPYEFCKSGSNQSGLGRRVLNLKESLRDIIKGFDYDYILNELCRVMKKINIYIWCNKAQIPIYFNFFLNKGCYFEILGWKKTNPIPTGNLVFIPDVEWCLYFRESGVKLYGDFHTKQHIMIDSVNQKDKKKFGHPTIKPIQFIKNFVINSSKEGDIILDTFMGSGTTAIACKSLNRHYIGAEINKEYYDICMKRINEEKVICGNLKETKLF